MFRLLPQNFWFELDSTVPVSCTAGLQGHEGSVPHRMIYIIPVQYDTSIHITVYSIIPYSTALSSRPTRHYV